MAAAHCAADGGLRAGGGLAHCALPVVALLGLAAMLWVAEGRRSQALPVVLDGHGRGAGAGVCLLRVFSGCLQLLFPLGRGVSLGFAGPGAAVLLRAGQRRDHGGRRCCPGVVSGRAQVMVLRQYSSAALRFGSHPAGHDRRSGQPRGCGRCRFCSRLWAGSLPTPTKGPEDGWRWERRERFCCCKRSSAC